MKSRHGKPIDLKKLKTRVISELGTQSDYWTRKAVELSRDCDDVTACPICRSANWKPAVKIHGFPWRQCDDCTHVFNGARPSEKLLSDFYAASDDTVNHADDYTDQAVRDYRRANVARPKVEYVAEFSPPPGRWLDVGCGNGDLLSVAKDMGYHGVGLEPNKASADIARDQFDLEVHELYLDVFADQETESFDVISFIGLLDLVPNPADLLALASRLLSPGGIVFASFPNYDSLSTTVQATYPDKVICRHMYPATLNAYTKASVERAFSDQGLQFEAVWFFGMDMFETLNNLALCAPGFSGSRLHEMLMERMNEVQAVFDGLEQCDKFHAIARKPA